MRHVAVFFDEPGFEDYPFDVVDDYRPAYHELAKRITDRGGTFSIARSQDTYLGKNRFSRGWTFRDGAFRETSKPFVVDIIYNKGYFKPDAEAVVLNVPELDTICTDKWVTCAEFGDLCPRTKLVRNEEELAKAAEELGPGDLIAKPVDGHEGKGIVKGSAAEMRGMKLSFPLLLQEFLDSSAGIPGLIDGIHDFRMIVVRGELILSYVRTPKPGGFLANVSQGGAEIPVALDKIPAGARDILKIVESKLARFPDRVYCLDVVFARGRWYIMELNSKPALSPGTWGPNYLRFQERLTDVLMGVD
jgi:hypothetical protein